MKRKTYTSKETISFSYRKGDTSTLISMNGKYNSVFTTEDEGIQEYIESSRLFKNGRLTLITTVELVSEDTESEDTESESKQQQLVNKPFEQLEVVENVTNVQEAAEYFKEHFSIPKTQVRSKSNVSDLCEKLNVDFPNFNF